MNLVRSDGATVIESAGLTGSATEPTITQLRGGNMVAVWSEVTGQPTDISTDTDGAIFAQILAPNGQTVGDIIQVNQQEEQTQDGPKVIAFANGGFGVAWTNRAVYGDTLEDNDVYLNLFDANGNVTIEEPVDIVPDDPNGSVDSQLTDVSFYSFGQYGVSLQDGTTRLFDTSSNFVAFVSYKPAETGATAAGPGDTVQLRDTNIVSAIASSRDNPVNPADEGDADYVDDIVSVVISNSRFDGPDGVPGITNDLIFGLTGAEGEEIEEVRLAALASGGFALSYRESVGANITRNDENDEGSVLRLEFLTAAGIRLVDAAQSIDLGLNLDDPRGGHDLISLSGGGVALAVVTEPGDGTGTDVEILIFDEDGALVGRKQALRGSDADQGKPDLEELADGRIALTFTDGSGAEVDGKTGPLQLTFFEITGVTSNYENSSGDDVLGGVSGDDMIRGLAGDDVILGRAGKDTLYGGAGNDSIVGGDNADALRGGDGDDTLKGQNGNDGIGGGAGDDQIAGGNGRDILGGGAGLDVLNGGDGTDLVKGGADADQVSGGAGNDTLRGGTGQDTLKGGAGDDSLIGGQDDDRLTGGGGADAFILRVGQGDDRVTDFDATEDRLVLLGVSAGDITVSTSDGDTIVDLGDDSMTLLDVTLAANEIDITFG